MKLQDGDMRFSERTVITTAMVGVGVASTAPKKEIPIRVINISEEGVLFEITAGEMPLIEIGTRVKVIFNEEDDDAYQELFGVVRLDLENRQFGAMREERDDDPYRQK